jgi:hypothetical protein
VSWNSNSSEYEKLSRKSILAVVALFAALGFAVYPDAYAWSSSPQIAASLDGSGNTILTIQFDFSQMSNPPSAGHHPTEFQVRTSADGSSWTELPPVSISPTPTTTTFTETYNLGIVSGTPLVQARLGCNIHGWSNWGPEPAIQAPEFPYGATAAVSILVFASGLLLLRKKRLTASS